MVAFLLHEAKYDLFQTKEKYMPDYIRQEECPPTHHLFNRWLMIYFSGAAKPYRGYVPSLQG